MANDKYVRMWFAKADGDYSVAEFIFGHYPLPGDIICFHCQQAAEKWLKAFLIFRGIDEPPYTHDITRLSRMCLSYDARFNEIKNASEFLTQFGIVPRYPDEFEISDSDARKAFGFATEIRDLAPLNELREIVLL
ncbi:MAG: HEPN domain-containing protein [Oscillospiraceae bacterium]|jgi:HEPN domain-containing protein|nr:HEPN domain-containing protein [Oscillospiraceae bacterium]